MVHWLYYFRTYNAQRHLVPKLNRACIMSRYDFFYLFGSPAIEYTDTNKKYIPWNYSLYLFLLSKHIMPYLLLYWHNLKWIEDINQTLIIIRKHLELEWQSYMRCRSKTQMLLQDLINNTCEPTKWVWMYINDITAAV